jgi:hypothetical protein
LEPSKTCCGRRAGESILLQKTFFLSSFQTAKTIQAGQRDASSLDRLFFGRCKCLLETKKANRRFAIPSLYPAGEFPVLGSSALLSCGAGFITHLPSPLAPFIAHLDVEGVGFAVENPPGFMKGKVFDHALFSPEGRMADIFVFLACHSVPPFRCVAGAGNTLSRRKTRKTKSPG